MSERILIPIEKAQCPECVAERRGTGQLYLEGGFIHCLRTAELLAHRETAVTNLCFQGISKNDYAKAWAVAAESAMAWLAEQSRTFTGAA